MRGCGRALAAVVDNAVRFTERGGVTVAVDGDGGGARVRVSRHRHRNDAAFVARAREPFAQESQGHGRTHEGNGVGLSVADRLVALMGGAVEVESERGVGTTVTLRPPPAEAGASGDRPPSRTAPPRPTCPAPPVYPERDSNPQGREAGGF